MSNSLNSYFSDDIMLLILVRLPVKSLLLFKTVSKSWNAEISSPKFIKLHLNQSRTNPDMFLFDYGMPLNDIRSTSSTEMIVVEFSTQKNLVGNIHRLRHPFEGSGRPGQPFVVGGPCNGLLCLHIYRCFEIFTICNPLTKSFRILPKRIGNSGSSLAGFYGFGYDDVHDDFKLFMASRSVDGGEIYSLRSNSWTRITLNQDFSDYFIALYEGILVNCALHWVLRTRISSSILAFDLREEKHMFLPIPELLEKLVLRLSVLNGCLLVKAYEDVETEEERIYDMWLMKDYGIKNSWVRITTHMTSYNIWLSTPVALLERKRKMLFYHKGAMLLYDLVKDEVIESTSNIQGCGNFRMPPQHEFVGSLVDPLPKQSVIVSMSSKHNRMETGNSGRGDHSSCRGGSSVSDAPMNSIPLPPIPMEQRFMKTVELSWHNRRLWLRSYIEERRFCLRMCPEEVRTNVEARGWTQFVQHSASANISIVEEFFAVVANSREDEVSAHVRGVDVVYSEQRINDFYCLPSIPEELDYHNVFHIDEDFKEEVRIFLAPEAAWEMNSRGEQHIHFGLDSNFPLVTRIWQCFVASRLHPSSRNTTINFDQAIILFAILTGEWIDVGRCIYNVIKSSIKVKRHHHLPFPSLITALALHSGVPVYTDDDIQIICPLLY